MASHLTIISGTSASGAIGKAFAGQSAAAQDAASEPTGLLGLFAALLDNAGLETGATVPAPVPGANSGQPNSVFDLAELFRLGLATSSGETTSDDEADPEALATAIDQPTQAATANPTPMVDFVEALSALKTSLDQGEALDPELLEQVENALSDLAQSLGLDIEALTVPEDFAALLESTGEDDTGLAGALTQLLAPLAQSLSTAQPATDAQQTRATSEATARLKALGDKLGALLAALADGDVPAEKLAALGMTPGQPLDAEIEAALGRFAAGLTQRAASVPEEPVLAAPTLKVSEPVLSGKTTDTPDTLDMSGATARTTEDSNTSGQQRDDNGPSAADRGRERIEPANRETRRGNAAATAPVDASNTPAPSADANAQATNAARIDAAANPRIIQAGYQTSQQQLNLPQIAFELARQVQDGNTRFQIRLDPPELGRIDVRLDINESGQVNARLVVEKSETLDLMQRDQRGLERALQQAGLDSSKTNLEFSLKQNPFAGQQGQMGDGQNTSGQSGSADENTGSAETSEEPVPLVNLYRGALTASGVNITV
ncbi:flagellar hook-length control protein FliK [Devosia subaequoris]|uniref:Flagellar hook-length control protein FliK n=1 Tax=Devosia subaequoris TaxID=395930 RepID=A0A7W6INC3_9HYPH|nr:flagellar hook-length control protein FliK [Devosia subaequoris]MBB4052787.1 flagellar hook-length control protein FliK [Devosia subaequoris]MCP1209938.1 flagellar hook-length control protein FliK [Devosia subaequoris]